MAEQRRLQWQSCLHSTLIALLSTHLLFVSALPFQETTSESTGIRGNILSSSTPHVSPIEEHLRSDLSEASFGKIFPVRRISKNRDEIGRIKSNELPASPAGLLKPDKFQFYTYNERGDMIMRQMTVEEIEALIAGGGAGHATLEIHEPQKAEDVLTGGKKVMDVVERVQNVLKSALGKKPETQINDNLTVPSVSLGASAEWSSILPSILETIETETTDGGGNATGQGDLVPAYTENRSTGTWESVTVGNDQSSVAASNPMDVETKNENFIRNDTFCRSESNFVGCPEETENVKATSHDDHFTSLNVMESTSALTGETTTRIVIPTTIAVTNAIPTEKSMIPVPVVTTGENLSMQSALEQQQKQPVFEMVSVLPLNEHYSQTYMSNSSDIILQDQVSKGTNTDSPSTTVQISNTHDDLDSPFTVTLEKSVTAKIIDGIHGTQDEQSTSRYDLLENLSSRISLVQETDPTAPSTETVSLMSIDHLIGTQSSKVMFATYQPSSFADYLTLRSTEKPYKQEQDKYKVKCPNQGIAPPKAINSTSNTLGTISEGSVLITTLESTENLQRETETRQPAPDIASQIKLTETWTKESFETKNDLPVENVTNSLTIESQGNTKIGVIRWSTHDSKTQTSEVEEDNEDPDIRKNAISSHTTPDQNEQVSLANVEEDTASSTARLMVESTEKNEDFQYWTQTEGSSFENSNAMVTRGTESTYPTSTDVTSFTDGDVSIVTITFTTDTTIIGNSNGEMQEQKEKPSNEKSVEKGETMNLVVDKWTIFNKTAGTQTEEESAMKASSLSLIENLKNHSIGKDSNVDEVISSHAKVKANANGNENTESPDAFFQDDDSKRIQPYIPKKGNEKDAGTWSKTMEGSSTAKIPVNLVNPKYPNHTKNPQIEVDKIQTGSITDTYDSIGTEKSTVQLNNGGEERWTLISHQTVSSTKPQTQDIGKPAKWSLATNKQEQIANTIPVFPEHAELENLYDENMVTTTTDININLEVSKTAIGLDTSVRKTSIDIVNFSRVCNELAFNFWIATNKGLSSSRSLALSPFGMISLLSMIFLGARGPTSEQMNEILRLDDVVTFNPHLVFQNVTDAVGLARGQGVADAAFVRELFADKAKLGKLLPFYKEQAQQFYDGLVTEVNFATIGDLVRRRTNLLIRKQTGGRVRDFVKTNAMPLRSPLAAISANVFQTDCSTNLTSSKGRDGELYFAVSPEVRQRRLVPVPATVWRSTVLAGYEPALDATAIAIGGTSDRHVVSTIFVLPGQQGNAAPGDTLERLEHRLLRSSASLRNEAWTKLLAILVPRSGLEVQLPKFSHRSIVNATASLKRMGLDQLFSGDADLKGINGIANRLYLTDAIQMNLFSICGDENIGGGRHHVEIYPTAANTHTLRRKRQMRSSSDKLSVPAIKREKGTTDKHIEKSRLKLDRPFLYFVRHNPTGLILHMGRFNPRLLP